MRAGDRKQVYYKPLPYTRIVLCIHSYFVCTVPCFTLLRNVILRCWWDSLPPHCLAIHLNPVSFQELGSNYKVNDLRKLIKELKCGEHHTQHFLNANSTDKAVV